ncbi:3-methyladenine DNA glycosylase [Lactobacillus selangorensis]|uniref:3-methyladenine DNA glycosylase n=1 Tax=Lactobacillus selangorensis TaxID=81857 RepID=A0A0R2FVR6_9LACO|nr:DNA-3-methyladenine glycosylase I [Lactobacillus selangorensis]KRN28964.1 3-methyladenine DNA glycosylase [Lactobacillus selangorensis]KRN32626.1 3-methyladenine DNA glycosylase [Lactobacillus selangorensis]
MKKTASGIIDYEQQWGHPVHDDQRLFELLTVGTFQAGLSWKVAAAKMPTIRQAFHGLKIDSVAAMMQDDLESIITYPGMIRNPRKIQAVVANAQAIVKLHWAQTTFSDYMWAFVDDEPKIMTYLPMDPIPNQTPFSQCVAKDMKKQGFKFVGPVITYMFMKASGMVLDQLEK